MKRKPKCGVGRKPVHQITDRAKRYRANSPQCKPFGVKRCAVRVNGRICGSRKNLVIGHRDGDESNTSKRNLEYQCKSCNTKLGKRDARIGRGVRTRQFNPDTNAHKTALKLARQYGGPVRARHHVLEDFRRPLIGDEKRRSEMLFWNEVLEELNRIPDEDFRTVYRKRGHGLKKLKKLTNPGAKTLGEYVQAAVGHVRGAHDEGGKVIHETPKGRRKSFAREIAFRKAHKNPKRKGRKKNPVSSAELYRQFHGRAGRRITDFPDDADYNSHKSLAQLGVAVSLYVGERCNLELNDTRGVVAIQHQDEDEPGWCVQIKFHPRQNPPHVAAEPSGRQIYFVGGNQDISEYLPKFHVDIEKDLLDLGPCMVLEYHTEKGFDGFRPQVYFHALGEESGGFPGDNGLNPRLMYNRVKRRLYLLGGSYRIKPEGIVD